MLTYSAIIPSPIGKIGIVINQSQLTNIHFLPTDTALKLAEHPEAQQVIAELTNYFSNPSHRFTLPFQLNGSPMQLKTWQALQTIPYGKTRTYGDLAKQLQTSARAIGQACRTNPLPIIIPCHRIVAANHVGGFAGQCDGEMLDIKNWLLKHEGSLDALFASRISAEA